MTSLRRLRVLRASSAWLSVVLGMLVVAIVARPSLFVGLATTRIAWRDDVFPEGLVPTLIGASG